MYNTSSYRGGKGKAKSRRQGSFNFDDKSGQVIVITISSSSVI